MPISSAYGTEASIDVIVAAPTQPTVTQQVIDNTVTLSWSDATATLPIQIYEIRRGSTWATATVVGQKQGNFTTITENTAGTYTYWVAGIDTAGGYGTPGSVSAQVNQPPDYTRQLNQNSTFSGTKTNIVTDASGLTLANVNTTETWTTHFTSRGWSTPQDQINAGYTYFAMPSTTSSSYTEQVDYGTVLAATKITATLTSTAIAGSTTITPTISVKKLSTDAWTDYVGVNSTYATNFRYVQIAYSFSSSGNDDLLQLNGLNIRFDSKLINDSGNATASSGDSGGTAVSFNVPFVRVTSITVTPATTSAVIATYNFTDVLNPTSFQVLLFNTSGARVSGNFGWSAKGV